MKISSVLAAGIRLIALMLFVRSILFLPSLLTLALETAKESETRPYVSIWGLNVISSVALACLLFFIAGRLARMLAPGEENVDFNQFGDTVVARAVFVLAVRIMGAFFVASSVPEIIGYVVGGFASRFSAFRFEIARHFFPGLISLLVGFYFLSGGRILLRFITSTEGKVASGNPSA